MIATFFFLCVCVCAPSTATPSAPTPLSVEDHSHLVSRSYACVLSIRLQGYLKYQQKKKKRKKKRLYCGLTSESRHLKQSSQLTMTNWLEEASETAFLLLGLKQAFQNQSGEKVTVPVAIIIKR